MAPHPDPIVSTTHGRLRGTTEKDVLVFRGIPYGASTAGEQRFRPPLANAPWTGIREAIEFGPITPQRGPLVANTPAEVRTIGAIPLLPQSEDCLVLNLWTPAIDDTKRPVMVWLHGRGFAAGAGSEGWYNGANLAKRGDVVVVTINHRLNVFGYLHLADLGGEKYAGSGVAGMLDAVLALQWVRDNAAAFGGDPGNVTIFGESGGGRKVCTLLAMPSAKGLFHRAIIQSSVTLKAVDATDGTRFAEQVLHKLGLQNSEVDTLQQLPFQQITDAIGALGTAAREDQLQAAPVVDGVYLPNHPFDPIATPLAADVPIMLGTNKDENAIFLAPDPRRRRLEEHELQERLETYLGDKKDGILSVYRRTRPEATPWDLYVGITSEGRRLAANLLAERQAATASAPVYLYLFDWESDYLGGLFKATHAMEIPFVFDNTDSVPMTGDRPDKAALAAIMSETWAAFARNGNPNTPGLRDWQPFDADRRATMVFDTPSHAEDDPRREERLAWAGTMVYR